MCNVLIAASSALTYIPVRDRRAILRANTLEQMSSIKMPAAIDADTFTGDEIAVD